MATSMPTTLEPILDMDRQYKTRILETDFGDGYKQRAADGINTLMRMYTVSWIGNKTQIDEYINHFEERGGYQSFTWTPPGESTQLKWICKEWHLINTSNNLYTLTATLEQVYDN